MGLAGELDDRWLGCASGWAGGKSGHPFARAKETPGPQGLRVKGNAPGNARGTVAQT